MKTYLTQAHCATSERLPLFGQILAALYQNDIVEEEDIRAWHALPVSRAEDHKPGVMAENMKKCWMIGSHMIQQLDAQETDSEEGDEGDEIDEEE
jgi:translation initiation factor eIF-2B subunit epsilon